MILNKKLIIVGTMLFALFVNSSAFAADEECEATIDLEQGNIEIPCLGLYDSNGDIVSDTEAYTVLMDQRGNSLNWEVTFVAGEGEVAELTECSSQIQIDKGILYIPCLTLGEGDASFEVYLETSQRGNSSNWKVLLIKDKETGEIFDYRTSGDEEETAEEESAEEEGDCPDENASQTAKDNHPECTY